MNQKITFLVMLLIFGALRFLHDPKPVAQTKPKQSNVRVEPQQVVKSPQTTVPINEQIRGNSKIENFDEAKRILKKIYADNPMTFYCGCSYTDGEINFKSCGFKPYHDSERAGRIEWEHIVPASDFGRSFKAWREGDPRCRTKGGKAYKGRKCARFVSVEFNRMESDLYNLVPEIGEVNAIRSDKPMGLLPGLPNQFGECKTKIANGMIEPREEIRGFIARTYKYMHHAYPKQGIISRKNEPLFEAWDRQYPPKSFERVRAQRIAKIQGNINMFVEGRSES